MLEKSQHWSLGIQQLRSRLQQASAIFTTELAQYLLFYFICNNIFTDTDTITLTGIVLVHISMKFHNPHSYAMRVHCHKKEHMRKKLFNLNPQCTQAFNK
jgi:hypothetical protein